MRRPFRITSRADRVRCRSGSPHGHDDEEAPTIDRDPLEPFSLQDTAHPATRLHRLEPRALERKGELSAEELQRELPQQVTATMTKAKRPGKVFLDWSQNAGSKTTIAPCGNAAFGTCALPTTR